MVQIIITYMVYILDRVSVVAEAVPEVGVAIATG